MEALTLLRQTRRPKPKVSATPWSMRKVVHPEQRVAFSNAMRGGLLAPISAATLRLNERFREWEGRAAKIVSVPEERYLAAKQRISRSDERTKIGISQRDWMPSSVLPVWPDEPVTDDRVIKDCGVSRELHSFEQERLLRTRIFRWRNVKGAT